MIDVIIPSCKPKSYLLSMIAMYKKLYDENNICNFIVTGMPVSAAINRNYGLLQSKESNNKYIIMMDDDIGGFSKDWAEILIKPLTEPSQDEIKLVSARLFTSEYKIAPMMGDTGFDALKSLTSVYKTLLSACIAFRKEDVLDKIWFDENFVGSGFEDTLFCHHLNKLYPESKIVINNECQLIHYHEMKEQGGENFYNNKEYFLKKCNDEEINKAIQKMRPYVKDVVNG